MSASYTALPNPRSEPESDRELDDAFGDQHSDNTEADCSPPAHTAAHSAGAPGAYDFEREYDIPPPGSPPRPSALALPNNYGNSNGLVPSGPIDAPITPKQPSFFRRAVAAILPTHYVPVPVASSSGPLGGGTENDGVFANVQAKPTVNNLMNPPTEGGDVHLVVEETQKEAPPVSLFFVLRTYGPVYDLVDLSSHMLLLKQTQCLHIGTSPSMPRPPASL